MALEELRQDRGERRLRQRHRAAGAQQPARLGARELDRFERGIRLGEHGRGVAVDLLADLGHHEASRRAVQEPHVQLQPRAP